jgi:hypothetical protein
MSGDVYGKNSLIRNVFVGMDDWEILRDSNSEVASGGVCEI